MYSIEITAKLTCFYDEDMEYEPNGMGEREGGGGGGGGNREWIMQNLSKGNCPPDPFNATQ